MRCSQRFSDCSASVRSLIYWLNWRSQRKKLLLRCLQLGLEEPYTACQQPTTTASWVKAILLVCWSAAESARGRVW
jgi:hypothetical protein